LVSANSVPNADGEAFEMSACYLTLGGRKG
jgi:hypothetical protein